MAEPRARSEQHASLVAAMVTALLMIVQQIGAKTTRDTFFLSQHPASALPVVMIGAAVVSLGGALSDRVRIAQREVAQAFHGLM